MAKRLTDKQKKSIIADRVSGESIRAIANKYGVSTTTIQKVTNNNDEVTQKVTQKAIENTADTLSNMAAQHETRSRIAGKLLKAIESKSENVDMFTNVRDLSTAYGIIVDKELKFAEIQAAQGKQDERKTYELPARVLGSEWVDVNREINERLYYQFDFEGGRGSLKSSYCAEKLVELVKANDDFCALAVRQTKDDIKSSVYAQIVWAIDELGLTEEFHCTKSPMEIRHKTTGQIIFFRHADDPDKIKSIRPPKGMHIGVVWIEEADQLHGSASLRNIMQSAFRGGDDGLLFRSYNVPRSQQHFINKEKLEPNPRRRIHHSHFKNAPKSWLGKTFYEIAEHLKQTNETAYRHEYDGEAVGNGTTIFENLAIREITDEEVSTFDRIHNGVDWGYYPDPWAFNQMHYDAARRTLYIFGELTRYKASNQDTAQALKDYGITDDDFITADSAEPKSVQDYKNWGLYCRGAEKGPGSVAYSHKWLQGLTEIVIDPVRCPDTHKEFINYEYERTKDGDIISGYPDRDNHHIDAVRYAMESVWKRRGE